MGSYAELIIISVRKKFRYGTTRNVPERCFFLENEKDSVIIYLSSGILSYFLEKAEVKIDGR